MAEATLKAMARGGIYDHIFDGFARYLHLGWDARGGGKREGQVLESVRN